MTHHWSTPTHQSTPLKQSMPHYSSNRMLSHHRLVPHHQSIYVNSVVNSTVNIVYVNSVVYPFMLLLRFLIVLSSKLLSVLLSDFSFLVKWDVHGEISLVESLNYFKGVWWSNGGVVNICSRWRNIVKFHEVGFENGGDRCIMDEGIRMRVTFQSS